MLTSLRLFTRAPCTRIRSWLGATWSAGDCASVLVAMLIGRCPQLTAFFTSAPIFFSSAAVNSLSAKEVGHMAPSSRFAASSKPNVAYLELNFSALLKKQTTLPSCAYAGIPYQVFGQRFGPAASMIA